MIISMSNSRLGVLAAMSLSRLSDDWAISAIGSINFCFNLPRLPRVGGVNGVFLFAFVSRVLVLL